MVLFTDIVSCKARYLIFHGSSVRDQLFEFAIPWYQNYTKVGVRFTKPTNMSTPSLDCNILSTRAFMKVQCNPSNPLSCQGEDPNISPASMPRHFRFMDNDPWTTSTRHKNSFLYEYYYFNTSLTPCRTDCCTMYAILLVLDPCFVGIWENQGRRRGVSPLKLYDLFMLCLTNATNLRIYTDLLRTISKLSPQKL